MSRNSDLCKHKITAVDDDEVYCEECGFVLGTVESRADYEESNEIDRYHDG
jgi:hypothetical protein